MLDAKIFLKAVDELEEKGISREVTIQALKESFESIFKKKNYEDTRVECDINVEKATIEIFSIKTIVEDVMDDNLEIALEDALLENPEAKLGEDHRTLHTLDSFTKADAMKLYGEAATLQLILDSKVLPEIVNAYSQPIAEAMSKIDSITMYGEGNTAKLTEEISKNGTQLFAGLEQATGLDIKSLLAGYLGGKLTNKKEEN